MKSEELAALAKERAIALHRQDPGLTDTDVIRRVRDTFGRDLSVEDEDPDDFRTNAYEVVTAAVQGIWLEEGLEVDQPPVEYERGLTIGKVSSGMLSPEDWGTVVGDRKCTKAYFADFGFAEENIGLLEFDDGTWEIGVGESLRGYYEVARGTDRSKMLEEFGREVLRHCTWNEEFNQEK